MEGFAYLSAVLGQKLFIFFFILLIFCILGFFICYYVFESKEKTIQWDERQTSKSENIRIGTVVCKSMLYVCSYFWVLSLIFISIFDHLKNSQIKLKTVR